MKELITIIDTTIVDQTPDTQTVVIRDKIRDTIVTIDIIPTIITEIIEEIQQIENRTTDIIREIEVKMGIITTITIKTE